MTIHDAFQNALKKANIKDLKYHDLKFTFASHFVMNGGDLLALKEILGRSTLDMVQCYAHLASEHKRKQLNKLAENFFIPHLRCKLQKSKSYKKLKNKIITKQK